MRSRPWPLVILAVLHLFAPIFNVVFPAFFLGVPLVSYLQLLLREPWWINLETLLLFPFAGLAIYSMKRWSYGIYFAILMFSFVRNYLIWKAAGSVYPLWLLFATYSLNFTVVGYFLLPMVRAPFMDPRLRWWETKPRFKVNWQAQAQRAGEPQVDVTLCDIAEGGTLVQPAAHGEWTPGENVVLSFSAFEKPYLLEGKVIRKLEHPWPGIAVQFNLGTRDQVAMIRSLIKEVRKSGAPETRPRIPVTKDFSDWWSRAAKNPRLLVLPEVPEHYQRKQERPTTGAAQ